MTDDPRHSDSASPEAQEGPQRPPDQPIATVDDKRRLETVRQRLEDVLNDSATTPRDLASVSREYRLVLASLADHAPSTGVSPADEIAARRRARGA